MDSTRAAALERILHALIEAGEGEAFMAVVKRIEAGESRVRINIEPPLDVDEMTFDAASDPMRYRRVA